MPQNVLIDERHVDDGVGSEGRPHARIHRFRITLLDPGELNHETIFMVARLTGPGVSSSTEFGRDAAGRCYADMAVRECNIELFIGYVKQRYSVRFPEDSRPESLTGIDSGLQPVFP